MSHLCVVPDTSSQLVAPAAEVVVHALPMEVHPTGGTGLQPGVVSCQHPHVLPSTVGHSRYWTLLPVDVFGLPDHDMDFGDDDMAPLELHLASGPSSSSQPSLSVTRAALGKR